jgi:hypothetical protein
MNNHFANKSAFSGNIAYHPELKYCYVVMSQGAKAVVCYQDSQSSAQGFNFKAIATDDLRAVA